MWERIGASSGIVIGAVVLFLLFALVLFIMERDEFKKRRSKRKALYLVPRSEYRNHTCRQHKPYTNCHDMKVRKIS